MSLESAIALPIFDLVTYPKVQKDNPMSIQPVIMVQIANRSWTLESLHSACQMARETSALIVLVKMIPVQHLSWLGNEMGYLNFSAQEKLDFLDYQATVEDYGLDCEPVMFQYESWLEATIQAVEQIAPQFLFAHQPKSLISLWSRIQSRALNNQLVRLGCNWIDNPLDAAGVQSKMIELNQPATSH
jgi:hypothetical protein